MNNIIDSIKDHLHLRTSLFLIFLFFSHSVFSENSFTPVDKYSIHVKFGSLVTIAFKHPGPVSLNDLERISRSVEDAFRGSVLGCSNLEFRDQDLGVIGCKMADQKDSPNRDGEYPSFVAFSGNNGGSINLSEIVGLVPDDEEHFVAFSENKPLVFRGKQVNSQIRIDVAEVSPVSDYLIVGGSSKDISGIVFDDATPIWMKDHISSMVSQMKDKYTVQSPNELSVRQKIVVAYIPSHLESFWWGDADRYGNISLRFYGSKWQKENGQAKTTISAFIAHELFHRYYPTNRGDKFFDRWLYEGGAEAYSIALLYDLRILSDHDVKKIFVDKINECRRAILVREYGLDELGRTNRFAYSCGFFASFKIDPIGSEKDYSKYFWLNTNVYSPINIWKKISQLSMAGQFDGIWSIKEDSQSNICLAKVLENEGDFSDLLCFIKELGLEYQFTNSEIDDSILDEVMNSNYFKNDDLNHDEFMWIGPISK